MRGVKGAIMPFPMYAALLSSHLIVTVADRVPEFDVGPSCRESTVPDCPNMENIARQKLAAAWSSFAAQDKATCVMEEKMSGPPSYVGWLTCLELNANARSAAASEPSPAAETSGKTAPARRGGIHRRH